MTEQRSVETIASEMASRRDEWVEILQELVRTPSENPPGDTTEIAEYYRGLLDDYGVSYEVIAPQAEMPNVLAQFEGEGDGDGPHLTFNGHLDTFPMSAEGRWDHDPFGAEIVDGKMYGRGVADMHAGFTASLAAFLYLFEHREEFSGTVTMAAVSDEETGGKWGAEYLVENHPEYNGDVVINGEPSTNGLVRFGERGPIWIDLRIRGTAAHISTLDARASAIDILAAIVPELNDIPTHEDLVDVPEDVAAAIREAEERMDGLLGEGATERLFRPEVNVGIVEGGEKANLVAEFARAEVDIRMPVGSTTDQALARVREIAADFPGEITAEPILQQDPTYSDFEHPIFQSMQRNAGIVRGETPLFTCSLGGSDCRFYRPKGIPCVVYGPTPYNIGAANEHVYVDDFVEVVQAQTMTAYEYLQGAAE